MIAEGGGASLEVKKQSLLLTLIFILPIVSINITSYQYYRKMYSLWLYFLEKEKVVFGCLCGVDGKVNGDK